MQELSSRVQAAKVKLEADTGRPPTAQDIAQYLEIDQEHIIEALVATSARRPDSLDAPIQTDDADEARTHYDLIGQDDHGYGLVEMSASLSTAIAGLPAEDRIVLGLRYVRGLTQREIGDVIGVSQMQVSRILRRVTTVLKQEL